MSRFPFFLSLPLSLSLVSGEPPRLDSAGGKRFFVSRMWGYNLLQVGLTYSPLTTRDLARRGCCEYPLGDFVPLQFLKVASSIFVYFIL